MVTIKEVAERANVGVGTVSRVINKSTEVSPGTRKRVQQAIRELNYSPNLTARRLSLGKTWQIAVILPYLTLPSYVERLRGVQQSLGSTDYFPILYSVGSPAQRDEYLATLSEKTQVDGLLLISIPISEEQTAILLNNDVPSVLIDSSNSHLPHIIVNDIAGGRMATQHLIDLGHQRIGFLSDFLETPYQRSGKDRYIGYCKALKAAGLPYQEQYVIEGKMGRQNAYLLARELLTKSPPPSAIFAASDTHAIGVIDAAKELGIHIPDDLSVIGYDGIRDAEYLNLTTISQPLFETGIRGATLLLDLIANRPITNLCVELPLNLIVRSTTGSPGS